MENVTGTQLPTVTSSCSCSHSESSRTAPDLDPAASTLASGVSLHSHLNSLGDNLIGRSVPSPAIKEGAEADVPRPGRHRARSSKSDVAKRIFSHIASSSSRSLSCNSSGMPPMTLERARAGPIGGGISGIPSHAESLLQASPIGRPRSRSTNSILSSIEKPLASTSGGAVSMTIVLQEPALFLRGNESSDYTERSSTMLRGKLLVKINKATKVKGITLAFKGRSRTEWPEGGSRK